MSRRAAGNNSVRGPGSALTAFLRDQGIDTRPVNTWRRRIDTEEEEGNAQAGPSTTPTRPTPAASTPARGSRNASGYASDNLDDSDEDTSANKKKKKQTKAELAKEKAKAKAKAEASKKRKRDEADYEEDDDEEDEYTAPSRSPVKAKAPDIGSFENCAECSKKFTVTKYTLARNPPPGFLCHACAKASGADPFKKPAAPKRRKTATEKRQVVNFESGETVKSLANICIEVISKHIDDIDVLGDVGSVNLANIAKIICKNRRLTQENVQLFYDVENSDLTLTDATALLPPALMTLASLNPNLRTLRLDLCGRITGPVLEHYGTHLSKLTRVEFNGPFLIREPAWRTFFSQVGPRLEGFLITQSPRFDKSCLEVLVQHAADTLTELRLCEIGKMEDDWLPLISNLPNLTYLDLSSPSKSLSDDAVIELLSLLPELRHLNLSSNVGLTDQALIDGVAAHTRVLDTLIMSTIDDLTDEGVAEFFERFKEHQPLSKIDFTRNPNLSSAALEALVAHSGSGVIELSINGWKETSNEALMEMAKQLPRVEHIDVGWCREVDDYVVKALLDECSALKSIRLYGCNRVTVHCPRKVGVPIYGNESHSVNT